MAFNILALTGEQIRAARALSRVEQTELARLSGLSLETIKRLERIRGPVDANARTLRAIQDAFETIGVQFEGDDTGRVGVIQRPSGRGDPRPAARPPDPQPRLHRLIYHSRIARRADESLRPTLAYIHAEAQTLHAGLDVTGIIFAREGHRRATRTSCTRPIAPSPAIPSIRIFACLRIAPLPGASSRNSASAAACSKTTSNICLPSRRFKAASIPAD